MEKTLGSGILGIIEKVSNHPYLKSIKYGYINITVLHNHILSINFHYDH